MGDKLLDTREELDFHYLLGLMPPLYNIPEYALLPEMFSIIGCVPFIILCKYAGGETVKIPELDELMKSIDALQWFYDVNIANKKDVCEIPQELSDLYLKIAEVYNVRECEVSDSQSK